MVRISPQNPAKGTSVIGDAIRLRRGTRGLTPLDQTLLNAPEIANGWNSLLGAIRTKNSLPDDVRELMILRVAARNSAAFEWIHHAHVGLDAGLTPTQLTIIRDLHTPLPLPSSPAPLSALQAAALRFADSSTFNVKVPQSQVDDLKSLLPGEVNQQLLEAAAVVAAYNMVSRLLISLDVGDMAANAVPLPETEQEEYRVKVDEGVELLVKVARRKEDPNAPWLVFVNSLMTNQSMWDEVLPRLSKTYNLITYDQRGHGGSSIPSTPCTLHQLSTDISKILATLTIPTPIHALIGVSQGGATTLSFAQDYPSLFSRLVTCDTQATSPSANSAAWDQRIALAREKGMEPLADVTVPRWFPAGSDLLPLGGGRRAELVKEMIGRTQVEGFVSSARSLQGYDVLPGLADALKKGGKKILLLAGERDGVLPVTLEALKDTLVQQGVDARFEIVKGSGHLPMLDGPREWLDIVEAFLKE